MLHRILAHARFFGHYVQANFLIALEYRATFITQILGMMLNDAMWVTFWWIYFARFQVLGGGWSITDVLALWAITAVGIGICTACCGNALRLAGMISLGDLDYYLALPKNVLLHVLVSRMDVTAWGDVLFGMGVFVLFLHPSPDRIVLFLTLALCGAVIFLAFNILWQSLSFWLGNAEGLATQMWNALITFTTYPASLFQGLVRVLLFTLLPAGFLSYIPVQLLRQFDPLWFLGEVAVAVGALAVSVWVFYRGLHRYESGNLLILRA
jgi:ABC-2 type transport system permease protein